MLVIGTTKKHHATIRRCCLEWRRERGWPLRCDNPACHFHSHPLEWNGMELPLILNHTYGNPCDNTPGSLRFLCPNCNSQNKETYCGSNIGRFGTLSQMAGTRHTITMVPVVLLGKVFQSVVEAGRLALQ